LVDDQFAAAADEDRRAFDQARPVLLVAAGREPPNASAVHRYAAENCDVTATDGIAGVVRLRTKSPSRGKKAGRSV